MASSYKSYLTFIFHRGEEQPLLKLFFWLWCKVWAAPSIWRINHSWGFASLHHSWELGVLGIDPGVPACLATALLLSFWMMFFFSHFSFFLYLETLLSLLLTLIPASLRKFGSNMLVSYLVRHLQASWFLEKRNHILWVIFFFGLIAHNCLVYNWYSTGDWHFRKSDGPLETSSCVIKMFAEKV